MKTGISLVELASQLEARKAKKVDMIAPTAAIEMVQTQTELTDDINPVTTPGVELEVRNQGRYPIRPIAHDQIGDWAGIPGKYYDRMLKDQPELLVKNVNTWLHASPAKRLVRTLEGQARAFLSNRYQRIENEEIAAVALPILLGDPDLTVVSSEVTERRLYIQAVTKRVEGEVKKGDVVQAGVIISNSEVGHGSVSVARVIWRLACLNGMILPDNKFRANHTGARLDDNEALWKDDTRAADDKAILLKVRDMVASAMDPATFAVTLDKMRGATEQKLKGDPAKAVEILSQKIGANEQERGGILRALIEGGDLSRWGVVNAVTYQAHSNVIDFDRSIEFEKAGATILDLPASEWNVIAEAA